MDKRIVVLTFAFATLALTHSSAEAAPRERTIVCESQGGSYKYCETGTTGEVYLRRQLSRTRCQQYDTWGADGDGSGIWVRDGCRAEFTLRERRGWGRWRDRDDDRYDRDDRNEVSRVRCESKNWAYRLCPGPSGARRARVVRQISGTRCDRGDTWDLDRRGIWVDRGCAAEFEVR